MFPANLVPKNKLANKTSSDPFASVLLPPENETLEQKDQRLREAHEKKLRSDQIDSWLQQDAKEKRKIAKKRGNFQILILGPENSGKSTFLKQVQLRYAPATLQSERDMYRTVVYISLIASLRRLLEMVDQRYRSFARAGTSYVMPRSWSPSSSKSNDPKPSESNIALLTKLRLAPIFALEDGLRQSLGCRGTGPIAVAGRSTNFTATEDDYYLELLSQAKAPIGRAPHVNRAQDGVTQSDSYQTKSALFVYPHKWKAMSNLLSNNSSLLPDSDSSGSVSVIDSSSGSTEDEDQPRQSSRKLRDPSRLLNECYLDMKLLIEEGTKFGFLENGSLQSGDKYFLQSLERIINPSFTPNDQDLLTCRVKTLGVDEHFISVEDKEFHICDVSGTYSRSARPVWSSFFSNATAIVYVCDLSAYDSTLPSNRTNQLREAIERFDELCKNPILNTVPYIILFLNKLDLVREKLRDPTKQVKRFFPEFDPDETSDATNPECFAKFISRKFRRRAEDPRNTCVRRMGRELKVYFTTCTDTDQMSTVIASVRDMIVTKRLENASIIM